ncbi:hypothetical protein I5M32_04040 [Pedobacter sp. SD-b]|uniref:PEP-CTERM protein-sorting domain-containing protein n=1 Tax=Pedobacter segetis TaxID=2793069 RepID=A0ABS1BID7_9SPHI|nr:hypothetical protein [Pedobacter segetis]MBK0382121.1 hypothetical protein [Pedobacter segetis]
MMRDFFKNKGGLIKVFFIFSFIFLSSSGYAFDDCSDPLNPNPDLPDCDPDLYVPIDDGVYFILIAGIVIGYKAFKETGLKLRSTDY